MSFAELRADERAGVEQLRRSLARGRLAHAYLLVGPRESDGETLVKTLAKALNCREQAQDSCDRCDSCRRIDAGTHPDIYWVRPESKSRRITVEQIREFERAISLRPALARMKVGVIVEADCLGEEASNAFLKTLEEPPARTLLVLLSAEPQRLLPTILSRCLKISYGVCAAPAAPYRDQLQPLLADFCAGGGSRVAHAYHFLARLLALLQAIRQKIREAVEAAEDQERYEALDPKVRERLDNQREARVEGEYRAAREQVLEEIFRWFADVWLCVEGADRQLLEHPDAFDALQRAARGLTSARACANLEAIEQIRESLARNISETLALEVELLKLAP